VRAAAEFLSSKSLCCGSSPYAAHYAPSYIVGSSVCCILCAPAAPHPVIKDSSSVGRSSSALPIGARCAVVSAGYRE
jgi:hypothetical protein